jgi:hypothetical protein
VSISAQAVGVEESICALEGEMLIAAARSDITKATMIEIDAHLTIRLRLDERAS